MAHDRTSSIGLPNGQSPTDDRSVPEGSRLEELERLCSQMYVAAVELGLPPQVLNQLWTTLAHGSHLHAFELELQGPASFTPDVRLVHRPLDNSRRLPMLPELPPLRERKTVLAVDDDRFMLGLVEMILRDENYELLTATSGEEALRLVDQQHAGVDLLVTDYLMPGLTGRELASALRTKRPFLRVLYQTGFTDRLFDGGIKELELNEGFIEKPFTARGLMEAARFALFGTLTPDLKTGAPPPAL